MEEENQKNSPNLGLNSQPNSPSRLGVFIFIAVLVTTLVVGGAVYAWQQQRIKGKNRQIKSFREEVNSLENKIEVLQGSSKNTQDSTDQSFLEEWKIKQAEDFSFEYPSRIDGDYINTPSQNWPPRVILKKAKTEELICEPGEKEVALDKQSYCFNKRSEGTAGTTYRRYAWRTIRNGKRISLIFSLGFSSCGALFDPDKCEEIQAEFDPHSLAEKILNSISHLN